MSKCKCCGQEKPLNLAELREVQARQRKISADLMELQKEANKKITGENTIRFQDAPWSLLDYVNKLPGYVCKTQAAGQRDDK